jgi:hypothetical protein
VASELAEAYLAAPVIKQRRLLSLDLPNRWNVAFDYHLVCWVIAAAYVPGA